MKMISEVSKLASESSNSGLNIVSVYSTAPTETAYIDLTGFWRAGVVNSGLCIQAGLGTSVTVSFTNYPNAADAINPAKQSTIPWAAQAAITAGKMSVFSGFTAKAMKIVFSGPAGSCAYIGQI